MKISLFFLCSLFFLSTISPINKRKSKQSIRPYSKNQWYWQYKRKPIMLLGASNDDNLFQWTSQQLTNHLDSMKKIGANYVRCTMSDRHDKGFEVYPFSKNTDGLYNLDSLNSEYFKRFNFFLKETHKREIIVQIEIWDRFDYSREHWTTHPFNPKNNINYTTKESGFKNDYPNHPASNKQPFFFTTPAQNNNQIVLHYQKKRVNEILNIAFKYPHVLYTIDNETSGEEKWSTFWAEFIQDKAAKKHKEIYITEMWDAWDLNNPQHKRTFNHPKRYKFCDVSQNNQKKGEVHWNNFQSAKKYLASHPRPMNTVKTYGADGGSHGNTKNGLERWWRQIINGAASARFHRPSSGLGLSVLSINSIKTAREIEKVVKFWELQPNNSLLSNRAENEAYLAHKSDEVFVLFFTDGGEVSLNLTNYRNKYALQWHNIRTGETLSDTTYQGGQKINITTPEELEWIAILIKKKSRRPLPPGKN